ncbi:hypothetical protein Dimus_004499 [Dionaea muscipula]
MLARSLIDRWIELIKMSIIGKIHSEITVPFQWEKQPGIPKMQEEIISSPTDNQKNVGVQVPLPPCLAVQVQVQVQPPLRRSCSSRISSRGGFSFRRTRQDNKDPFFVAYTECTKNYNSSSSTTDHKGKSAFGFAARKSLFGFSCKNSYDLREDAHHHVVPRKKTQTN